MNSLNLLLLSGGALLFLSLLLGTVSLRFGVPSLLVFLVVGMLAGEDGFGGIEFSDFESSFMVSNLALAIILLDGGLRTRVSSFSIALRPALSLATFGVILTSAIVGAFATWLLDVDWRLGLLMGGIIGSTDAAAVFSVIQTAGVQLHERVASTLEVESGMNDPMAIFITVLLIEILLDPEVLNGMQSLLTLLEQFGIGALMGISLGALLAELLLRLRSNEGVYALLLCSGGTVLFAVTAELGGSGFLAVYVAGMIAGNRKGGVGDSVLRSMDSLAWLAQSAMFLLLGLLVTPSELGDHGWQALAIAAFLTFFARPMAVWLCLLPFSFDWREKVFIAWTGLRGAVPIVLAMFPLMAGIEQTRLFFDVTFVVVLTSLLVQGTTMGFLAQRLGLALPAGAEPLQMAAFAGSQGRYLMQFQVGEGARLAGKRLTSAQFDNCLPVVLLRGEQTLPVEGEEPVRTGDRVTWLAPLTAKEKLADLCRPDNAAVRRFFGDFSVRGDVRVGDLLAAYGLDEADADIRSLTVNELFRRKVGQPVVGDMLRLGMLQLRVRIMEGDVIDQVGIRLPGGQG